MQEDVLQPGDAHYKQFHKIFEAFKLSDDSEDTPKATPTSHIPDDDSMSIAAKSSAAQKKQREEESEDVSFVQYNFGRKNFIFHMEIFACTKNFSNVLRKNKTMKLCNY